jgi:hypothetical protein
MLYLSSKRETTNPTPKEGSENGAERVDTGYQRVKRGGGTT